MSDPAPIPNPELTTFIGAGVGRAERLLSVHVADRDNKCKGCPNGSHGRLPWPCQTQIAATWVRGRQARASLRSGRPR